MLCSHLQNGVGPLDPGLCPQCDALLRSAQVDRANQYHMPTSDKLLIDMEALDLYRVEWPREGKTTSIIHASV